ncbi:MAG: hypothetical protein NTX63_03445 [Candidatus Peregrinibacteria bacterium]|nr:hypothetical protein [Candidatus Peregrinibacteria bacterium]
MSDLHHLGLTSPLENIDDMVSHLELSLSSKNLTAPQKIQALRDLLADDIGENRMFQDACQSIISRLQHDMANVPTISIVNAHVLLSNPTVLSRLQMDSLQTVVGGDIAFRISCLEELRRIGRMDLLFKQVGHLSHWKEGQAMIHIMVTTATSDQLSRVFMEFIHNRFSSYVDRSFGPHIFREESIDALFSAVISRANVSTLYALATEFKKGAAAIGLPAEQFDRYASVVTVKLAAAQMRDELSGLVDLTHSPAAHAESDAFWVADLPPKEEVTSSGTYIPPQLPPAASPVVNPPTRMIRPPFAPGNLPNFAPAPSPPPAPPAPLPPRRSDSEDESAAFDFGDDDSQS